MLGGHVIDEMLKVNTTLTSLDLGSTQCIQDEGAIPFANALIVNASSTSLHLKFVINPHW
jgi:Leucine Rich repeat